MQKSAYGLLVWFVATLFVIYAFCLNTAAAVFSEAIKASLNASNVEVSYAVGAFVLGFACMQIPAGYLLNKYNPRYVVSAGVIILAIGNILTSFSDSLTSYILSNLIQGIGGSFAFIAAALLISAWFPAKSFPILFGLTQTLSCVLAGIIHYGFVYALSVISWNLLYQYLSIFGLILFILSILVIKLPPTNKIQKSTSLLTELKMVISNKQLWLCGIAAATSFGILLSYGGFWYVNVQNHYAVDATDSLIISAMVFAGIGIGTPIWGVISNYFRSRKLIIHVSLVVGNMMLLLGLYLPHLATDSLILIKVISFLIGFALSGSMMFYTVCSELSTDITRGVALGLINTLVFLFNSLMMFIPYFSITAASSSFFTYLWMLPFFIMISILLAYFVKETY